MTHTPLLIIPGRGNSGAGHWQTLMETRFSDAQRVEQDNWETPVLEAWSQRIDEIVCRLDHRPLLVAHSFGCLAAAHAQITLGTPVGATLFVAPADPKRFGLPNRIFRARLLQPGLLIASNNDPWMSHDQAVAMADAWGIGHITLENGGHINIASGHGHWPLGETIVEQMLRQLGEVDTFPVFEPLFKRHVAQPNILHISK